MSPRFKKGVPLARRTDENGRMYSVAAPSPLPLPERFRTGAPAKSNCRPPLPIAAGTEPPPRN